MVSAKKRRLFEIITKYTKKHGCPPLNREMSELSGWPISTVHRICVALAQAGLLRKEETGGRKFWPIEED